MFRTLDDLNRYLLKLDPFRIRLGLAPTRAALARLGRPERKMRIVHVAGTNGKGSVCAMTASLLGAAGYRTGLYTSPHILDLRERIRVDRRSIGRKEFVEISDRVARALGRSPSIPLTHFEFLTAVALAHFAERAVDFAVLETGMGGRLDATNAVLPDVSVITTIGLDHTEWLGQTIHAIAAEKAGIIKPGVPVVAMAALTPIVKRASALRVPLRLPLREENWAWAAPNRLVLRGREWPLPYRGSCYAANALLALAAVEAMGLYLPAPALRSGLSGGGQFGRGTLVRVRGRRTLLDVAHNPQAIETLGRTIQEVYPEGRRIVLLGLLAHKDAPGILRELREWAAHVVLTQPVPRARAYPVARLAELASAARMPFSAEPSFARALESAVAATRPEDLLVITGSHTTVAAFLKTKFDRSRTLC